MRHWHVTAASSWASGVQPEGVSDVRFVDEVGSRVDYVPAPIQGRDGVALHAQRQGSLQIGWQQVGGAEAAWLQIGWQ